METLKRYYPYLILTSALILSTVSAYYSVDGIGKIFSGASTKSMIMAGGLEFSKTVLAGALHIYWSKLWAWLRYYLLGALVVLMLITSMGIYGLLSDAYHATASKEKESVAKIELVKRKREMFSNTLVNLTNERTRVNESLAQLRKSIATDNQYQTVVGGKIVTQIQSTSKKAVNEQLNVVNAQASQLDGRITALSDTVTRLDLQIIELQYADKGGELGALKYLSNLTGMEMDKVANIFMMVLIFVFDPLAICLVLASLFAFTPVSTTKPTKVSIKKESVTEAKSGGLVERLVPSTLYKLPPFYTFTDTKVYSTPNESNTDAAKNKKRGRPRKATASVEVESNDVAKDISTEPVITESQTPQKKFDFEIPSEPEQVIPETLAAPIIERPKRKRKSTVVETDLPTQVTTSINDAVKNEEHKKGLSYTQIKMTPHQELERLK